MYDPGSSPPNPSGGDSVTRGARYAYLVGRLRSRQITMEEATEMFGIMQGMLQRSEAARVALAAAAGSTLPPPTPKPATASPTPSSAAGSIAISDETILLGLLALGAGAGLVTAVTKRFQETAGAKPSGSTSAGSTRA